MGRELGTSSNSFESNRRLTYLLQSLCAASPLRTKKHSSTLMKPLGPSTTIKQSQPLTFSAELFRVSFENPRASTSTNSNVHEVMHLDTTFLVLACDLSISPDDQFDLQYRLTHKRSQIRTMIPDIRGNFFRFRGRHTPAPSVIAPGTMCEFNNQWFP
jgi:hypothetical protein